MRVAKTAWRDSRGSGLGAEERRPTVAAVVQLAKEGLMADPIWLDACIVARVGNGDKAVEAELVTLQKKGHQLLVVGQAGDPVPQSPDHETEQAGG